ncbi:uncharacterized protein LOC124289156 isoform X3 [Haliotis rubra]|uniref:uncharacterized protein LOC124289156 isoform X3 n=1 Tax=Haliotis rubra TaxID=36100 RepID=UPI001EE61EA2|nr:uncharacterized protein LOC124289156 isoform X3 [Haliotis rubra]
MNLTVEQTTPSPQAMSLSMDMMWVPYTAIVLLFVLGLGLSFRRHRRRYARKKQYILEYQEENLSVRRPRIRGKLAGSDAPVTVNLPQFYSSEAAGHSHVYQKGHSDRLLSTDDIRFSLDDFPNRKGSGNVKKRFRSAYDLDELNTTYYRQISDDDYFRRKRPREYHYIKSVSDRHLSPGRRRRVHDCDVTRKSFWIRSDVRNPNEGEIITDQPAVKYIKVFDLDLCDHCRMYVEKVDGSMSKASSPRGPMEKVYGSNSVDVGPLPRIQPQASSTSCFSIAEVHSPPHPHPRYQFQPIERHNSSENVASRTQLLHSDSERPRSAPDLNKTSIEMSEFLTLSVQGKSDVSIPTPTVTVM